MAILPNRMKQIQAINAFYLFKAPNVGVFKR